MRVQAKRRTETGAVVSVNSLSLEFGKLLKSLGINSRRNFYALRHNFETIAGESKDQVAVDAIMGHVDPSMGAKYREAISDARLRAVTKRFERGCGWKHERRDGWPQLKQARTPRRES